MDLSQILESIPVKTEEDIIAPKFELEDAQKIHRLLTLDNPLTYAIFLDKRPDLSEEDRETVFQIIKRLQENETLQYRLAMEKMFDPCVEEKQVEPEEKVIV